MENPIHLMLTWILHALIHIPGGWCRKTLSLCCTLFTKLSEEKWSYLLRQSISIKLWPAYFNIPQGTLVTLMSQASQQDFWPDVNFHITCLKLSRSKLWANPCQWVPWINPAANISSNHSAFRPVNLSEKNWSSHRWARMTICKMFSRVTMMSCSSVCVCDRAGYRLGTYRLNSGIDTWLSWPDHSSAKPSFLSRPSSAQIQAPKTKNFSSSRRIKTRIQKLEAVPSQRSIGSLQNLEI